MLNRILAVPGMLFAAGHAKNDIPSVLNTYAAQHPGFEITYGRELGVDLKMLRAAGDRIAEGIAASPRKIPHAETLLLVVGRGASDPGCQFQCRQGHAHAVGGHGLRLGRDRLFRRHLPAGRPGARSCGEARLSPHRGVSRISCSPACW
ncbi:MAG: CbiX/SirB N-terminal domain-containing protein [Candidatus Promineifilaceae bacterium]